MTLPTPDAQSSRLLPDHPHSMPAVHSMPAPAYPSSSTMQPRTSLIMSGRGLSDKTAHDRAIDITAHSWDLATDDLKTLTAKRELPLRLDRRANDALLETVPIPQSSMFTLVIWVCAVAMLISGGIVLFVIVQP